MKRSKHAKSEREKRKCYWISPARNESIVVAFEFYHGRNGSKHGCDGDVDKHVKVLLGITLTVHLNTRSWWAEAIKMSIAFHPYNPLFSTHLIHICTCNFCVLLFKNCCRVIAPKKSRLSQAFTSCAPPPQDAALFPNYLFSSQANVENYLKIKDFKVVKILEGFEELCIMLEERGWMRLNSMINETNQSIGSEFYANVVMHPFKDYTCYVQGKYSL